MNTSPINRLVFSLLIGVAAVMGILLGLKPPEAQANLIGNSYFVTPGGIGDCSQSDPCTLPIALPLALDGDSIYLGEGIYTGTGAAVVTVTHSIDLLGGWDSAPSGPIVRNPDQYVSQLDGERQRRVVNISQEITPALDGLTIAHGNATKLILYCSGSGGNPDGCGGGIFSNNAHPIISNNVISDNIATISTVGFPTGTTGYGGGIYLLNASNMVIKNNRIINNVASTADCGYGGGIYIRNSFSDVQLNSNEIAENFASTKNVGCAWGGGIGGNNSSSKIEGNYIHDNWSNGSGAGGSGGGIHQWIGSDQYKGNRVTQNHGYDAVYLGLSEARFEQNLVVDNQVHVDIDIISASGYGPKLINNMIVGDTSNKTIWTRGNKDNIITTVLFYNTLVGSGSGTGIYVGQYTQLYLTNTIVVSYTWGITNVTPVSSTIQAEKTLFDANTYDGIVGNNPVFGDPVFVNPAADNFHIQYTSQALDAGVCTHENFDIDGDIRPFGAGCDIGADEWSVKVYLPLVVR